MAQDQFQMKVTRNTPAIPSSNPTQGKKPTMTPRHKRLPVFQGSVYEHVTALMEEQTHIEKVWISPDKVHFVLFPVEGWEVFNYGDEIPETDKTVDDLIGKGAQAIKNELAAAKSENETMRTEFEAKIAELQAQLAAATPAPAATVDTNIDDIK